MPRAIVIGGREDLPGDRAATSGRRDTRSWNPARVPCCHLEQPSDEMELVDTVRLPPASLAPSESCTPLRDIGKCGRIKGWQGVD